MDKIEQKKRMESIYNDISIIKTYVEMDKINNIDYENGKIVKKRLKEILDNVDFEMKFDSETRIIIFSYYQNLAKLIEIDKNFITTMYDLNYTIDILDYVMTNCIMESSFKNISTYQLDVSKIFDNLTDLEKIEFIKVFGKVFSVTMLFDGTVPKKYVEEFSLFYNKIINYINKLKIEEKKEVLKECPLYLQIININEMSYEDEIEIIKGFRLLNDMPQRKILIGSMKMKKYRLKEEDLNINNFSSKGRAYMHINKTINIPKEYYDDIFLIEAIKLNPKVAEEKLKYYMGEDLRVILHEELIKVCPDRIINDNIDYRYINEKKLRIILEAIAFNPAIINKIGNAMGIYSKELLRYAKDSITRQEITDDEIIKEVKKYESKIENIIEAYNNLNAFETEIKIIEEKDVSHYTHDNKVEEEEKLPFYR